MSRCPDRDLAYHYLTRLERARLKNTRLWNRLAEEQSRDLLTAESRLNLMVYKAAPLVTLLVMAGRSKRKRMEAMEAIRNSRIRVR